MGIHIASPSACVSLVPSAAEACSHACLAARRLHATYDLRGHSAEFVHGMRDVVQTYLATLVPAYLFTAHDARACAITTCRTASASQSIHRVDLRLTLRIVASACVCGGASVDLWPRDRALKDEVGRLGFGEDLLLVARLAEDLPVERRWAGCHTTSCARSHGHVMPRRAYVCCGGRTVPSGRGCRAPPLLVSELVPAPASPTVIEKWTSSWQCRTGRCGGLRRLSAQAWCCKDEIGVPCFRTGLVLVALPALSWQLCRA